MRTTAKTDDLKQALRYDPATGIFRWAPGTRRAGQQAGHQTKRGHWTINRKAVLYQAHQVAWLLYYGDWPTHGIDHIDGDPSNNRIANLRDVGQPENTKNRSLNRNSSSGVAGVSWCKESQKWRAYVHLNGKPLRLGFFASFNEAVQTRKAAERQYGYHPNHGRKPQP